MQLETDLEDLRASLAKCTEEKDSAILHRGEEETRVQDRDDTIVRHEATIQQQSEEIKSKDEEIRAKDNEIQDKEEELEQVKAKILELQGELGTLRAEALKQEVKIQGQLLLLCIIQYKLPKPAHYVTNFFSLT